MSNTPVKKPRIDLDGVLLLDKPVGLSSNDALRKVKRLLNVKKAGHTGTLDPFATGLLPLCFGEATKFSQDLLDADKVYETVVRLGVCTSTGDTEGEVTETHDVNVNREQIEVVLKQFQGEIQQVPPMHSALKRDGKPLYEYARAGITLERDARDVTIYAMECLDYQAPFLTLRVKCSKGTYIRVLGEDIGKALGCGAHLQALRRIQVGHLTLDHAHSLEAIEQLPEINRTGLVDAPDSLLSTFPEVVLTEELAKRFLQGQRLPMRTEGMSLPQIQRRVRVYRGMDKRLLGTGLMTTFGVLAPERVIANVHVRCEI
ncbi:MAG: tRNA pseudouridine(55) synthase TruB [Oxalobacter sp.]|nr:MAG: tRNA pseudouridine(55) synthase TruB [Oxalobacter sp.]